MSCDPLYIVDNGHYKNDTAHSTKSWQCDWEMSLTYSPTNTVTYNDFWGPLFLASRDVTGQVPINKVEYAGVNVQAACSPDNVFDSKQYQTCLSNLLATQFRWFTLDIYWDSTNNQFGLCPVQIPSQDADIDDSNTSSVSGTETGAVIATATVTSSSSSSTTTTVDSGNGDGDTDVVLELGPYKCSKDLTLDNVLGLFRGYFADTSTKLLAHMILLELNLHAATLPDQAEGPAPTPSAGQLPSSSQLLSALINDNDLQGSLYPFSELLSDRSNLNTTWYSSTDSHRMPFTRYFNTTTHTNASAPAGDSSSRSYLSTEDGWPSENYLLFSKLARLLISWGTIDEQMAAYDFAGDSAYIFPSSYIPTKHSYEAAGTAANGTDSDRLLRSGCFYNDSTTNLSRVNVSWAQGYINSKSEWNINDKAPGLPGNLTSCGISPFLNTSQVQIDDYDSSSSSSSSRGESAAAAEYNAYLNFTSASVMGWAPGEPQNSSDSSSAKQFRCAVLDTSTDYAYRGRWRVENCQQQLRAACRVDSEPFRWRLTTQAVTFHDAADACQALALDSNVGGLVFDQPHTGLENTYLYRFILNSSSGSTSTSPSEDDTNTGSGSGSGSGSSSGIWINLNSLDHQGCWITTGANGTCAYIDELDSSVTERQILLPTIGALIVLFLALMTMLIKCNTNYRHNRKTKTKTKTKTGPGGWEYEGVPS